MLPWLFAQKGKYNKMCCPLEPIRPSPAQVNLPKCVKITKFQTLFSLKPDCCWGTVWPSVMKLLPLCLCRGRQSTETSVNSSFPRAPMVKKRPSASAWGSTKVDRARWWGPRTRATSQPRPSGWCASSRSSSGIRLRRALLLHS